MSNDLEKFRKEQKDMFRRFKDDLKQNTDDIEEIRSIITDQTLANYNLERSVQHKRQAFEVVKQLNLMPQSKDKEDKGVIDKQLLQIELANSYSDQLLEIKRSYWGQELLEAKGFHLKVEEAELAHNKNLINAQSAYAPKVASIQEKFAAFELQNQKKAGVQKLQTGLAIAEESLGNLAAHSNKAFKLQRAAALANATIDIAEGIVKALKKGFPVGAIEAGLVAVAGAVQIASIRAQKPPQAFAYGGIVDTPTFFSARGISQGLAGEAGPEAILPLRRLPGGQLGVGSIGRATNPGITFAPVVQVSVEDAGEGAASTGETIGQAVREQLESLFQTMLASELRPGGLLNSSGHV